MKGAIRRFVACRAGVTSVEYALLALGMSVAIVAAAQLVGTALQVTASKLSSNLS